jgi:transcriptional regulator with XRE-family HTH domain
MTNNDGTRRALVAPSVTALLDHAGSGSTAAVDVLLRSSCCLGRFAEVGPDDVRNRRKALGRRLALFREAAGYTQREFAPLTLYGRSTIANVETGGQRAPREFWQRCDELLRTGGVLTADHDEIILLEQQFLAASPGFRTSVIVGGFRRGGLVVRVVGGSVPGL